VRGTSSTTNSTPGVLRTSLGMEGEGRFVDSEDEAKDEARDETEDKAEGETKDKAEGETEDKAQAS
jgi:hypothetical protein